MLVASARGYKGTLISIEAIIDSERAYNHFPCEYNLVIEVEDDVIISLQRVHELELHIG